MALFLSAAVIPAAASEQGTEARVVQPESYLGRLEDETGVLLEDDVAVQEAVPSSRFMFSMTASGVTDLLTTYRTAKKFTRSDLNGGALYITGTLNNSTGQHNATSKVGACTYNSSFGTFDAVTDDYFPLAKKKQQADINILFSRKEKHITATLKTIIATVRFPGQSRSTA